VDIAERVIAAVAPHPAVRDIRLVGSRAEGRAIELSDWDFLVETNDFAAIAGALPHQLAPLEPVAQQWDRLSTYYCWMLIVAGPVKIDLIFADEPHADEPPWEANGQNLDAIDAHFWDWMFWLKAKEASGKLERVHTELAKLFEHLLAPLQVQERPSSIAEAVAGYRAARERAEQRFGVAVGRELEAAVAPAFAGSRAQ
jgi:hypothetical protein